MTGETIALFGATGMTGKKFLKLALEGGFQVQAMVRDKSKVDTALMETHGDKLIIVEGDFSNKAAITKTAKGATYVVSMAGGPSGKPKEYPPDLMLNFFKTLAKVIQDNQVTTPVKVVLYQAGTFNPLPDQPLPMVTSIFKKVIGEWVLGLGPNVADHTAVIQYIYDNRTTLPFQVIVSRPGVLSDKPSKAVLKADHFSSTNFPITFHDLAVFSLAAIQDESLYGKFPFVVPIDKDHLKNVQPSIDKVANPVVQPMTKATNKVIKPGITEPLDKTFEPVAKAAGNAVDALQGATKPVRDQIEKILS